MARTKEARWVVMGGKIGETAHCTRCGEGLSINLPQPVEVLLATLRAFGKLHLGCTEGMERVPESTRPSDWLQGRDTGISSLTIYSVMTNTPTPASEYCYPHDPSDFGRCYRLLQLFPDFRKRMHEVAARFPEWGPMVERWDEMTSLFELEAPQGTCPKLYALMKDLARQGDALRKGR